MSVRKTTATAATLAYVERVFRYFASLRYFLDRADRLLAFVSRAERNKRKAGRHQTLQEKFLKFRISDFIYPLTRECLPSLQNLLNIRHHDSLDTLELCVNAAQVPPGPAVHIASLGFLNVCVCEKGVQKTQSDLKKKKIHWYDCYNFNVV